MINPNYPWGYDSDNGPDQWHKNYPTAKGRHQSPIEINNKEVHYDSSLLPWFASYDPGAAKTILNNGKTCRVMFDDSFDRSEQHQIYQWLHLLHKSQRILKGREYPGTTIYHMDAALTRKSRKFGDVLNNFSDELLSNCCVLISEVKSDSLQKKLSFAVLRGGPLPGVFRLRQLHFHWGSSDDHGSEHVVNGVRYAGELHVLHWNPKYSNYLDARRRTDGVAVLAIFLQVGETPKPEMKRILEEINAIKTKGKEVPFPNFDPSILFPKSHDYWTYHGSFTTPPCEECVTWIILREPIIVSSDQMAKLRSLSKNAENEPDRPLVDNWRPTQPRYFRMVSASFL
ncbi:carbonic anhydrase 3-like isoform X3 [Empidonax traillii]|uniref:carbonic anhydrase 3-like isoform X3 n=1 Tax=Empidonax traillii TaxID=164674 RepID=UPI000FFDBAAF|nr:carbonic anhydrase 3-like isoform X3 [Empidonax traillii]